LLHQFGDAEIEHARYALSLGELLNHYVLRLEISMNYALPVRFMKARAYLFGDADGPSFRKRAFIVEHLAKRYAFDIFHHDVGKIGRWNHAEIGNHHDVRMVYLRKRLSFSLESQYAVRIGVRLIEMQQFQSESFIELKMGYGIDLPH